MRNCKTMSTVRMKFHGNARFYLPERIIKLSWWFYLLKVVCLINALTTSFLSRTHSFPLSFLFMMARLLSHCNAIFNFPEFYDDPKKKFYWENFLNQTSIDGKYLSGGLLSSLGSRSIDTKRFNDWTLSRQTSINISACLSRSWRESVQLYNPFL